MFYNNTKGLKSILGTFTKVKVELEGFLKENEISLDKNSAKQLQLASEAKVLEDEGIQAKNLMKNIESLLDS
jgi:hypothetical protein